MDSSRAHLYIPEGVLSVEGPDAASFLQGQFSQDLRGEAGSCFYGLWLSHKGKIKADSFVLKLSEEQFLAVSYFGETQALRDNLEARIIMDEVETSSPGSGAASLSLWGAAIGLAMEALGLERPDKGTFRSKENVYAFWGRRGLEPCLEILCANGSDADALKQRLADEGIRFLSTEEVSALSLSGGCFQVGRDILESDLPQEVGLAGIAVSYTKGCYIGQEVMARLKSMGRPRRTLEWVGVSEAIEGAGPWSLVAADGVRAGELRRIVKDGERLTGSAMLKRSVESETSFRVEEAPEVWVERLEKEVRS